MIAPLRQKLKWYLNLFQLQLECQYDVTVVRFCNTDGNYIAGGTSSGQVVLWDITGRLETLEKAQELTSDEVRYRKIMVNTDHSFVYINVL